jgi:hypothetical protein
MTNIATTKIRKTQSERLILRANTVVPRALKALSNVALLANLNPTQEQRNKILARLETQVEALREAFTPQIETEGAPTFRL